MRQPAEPNVTTSRHASSFLSMIMDVFLLKETQRNWKATSRTSPAGHGPPRHPVFIPADKSPANFMDVGRFPKLQKWADVQMVT